MSEHHGPTILEDGEPGRNEQNAGFPYHTLTRLLKFTNEDEVFGGELPLSPLVIYYQHAAIPAKTSLPTSAGTIAS